MDTGDFIVCLSVQGSTGLVTVGKIEAPKETYTVTYYGKDGVVVDTQTVKENENAAIPDALEVEGYTFVTWDESGTNITRDTDIYAKYVANTYAVVFIDWINGNAYPAALEYGTDLTEIADAIVLDAPGHSFVGWDLIRAGQTTVTGNMVISAVFDAEQYTVKFYDGEGEDRQLLSTQLVKYGDAAVLPDEPIYEDGRKFLGWATDDYWWYVTEDMEINALYSYPDTANEPISNLGGYAIGKSALLELTTGDDQAVIWYTTNGEEPVPGLNAEQYTGPILIEEDTVLMAVSIKEGANNSDTITVTFDCSMGAASSSEGDAVKVGTYYPVMSSGEEVTLNVEIENNPGILAYLFYVECDTSHYSIVYDESAGTELCTAGSVSSGGSFLYTEYEYGYKIMWFNTTASESDGNLFALKLLFSVDENEEPLDQEEDPVIYRSPITVSYSAENLLDASYENIDCDFAVSLPAGSLMLGDVNGDGYITTADVIRVAKYRINAVTFTEDQREAADVNGDSKITNADIVRLARYILGLVELG